MQGQQSWNFFKYNFSNHVPYTGDFYKILCVDGYGDPFDQQNCFLNRGCFKRIPPQIGFAFLPVAIKFSKGSKNIRQVFLILIDIIIVIIITSSSSSSSSSSQWYQVGLSDWARFDENGTESVNPIFPYRSFFKFLPIQPEIFSLCILYKRQVA